MSNVITPHSWKDLLDALYADSWDKKIDRYRSPFAFRGLANKSWRMATSLMRIGGEVGQVEKHLLRNFRKYAHRDVVEQDSFWYWMAMAQHHGLPTRLLDWTFSPFVALHFATNDISRMEEDGVIWCVDITKTHEILPKSLKKALSEEGAYVFTVEMLSKFELPEVAMSFLGIDVSTSKYRPTRIRSMEDFDRMMATDFTLFLEPPSIDDRIVNQFALFSVMSNSAAFLDEWLLCYPDAYRQVIIPSEIKWEVRDKLDQANITERVLFPGLDGLSSWLKRHYGPKR